MNARRKHRIFADHKPPLVAFFVVAMTSVMLLVHVARSDAAPGWLRQGVASVVAGGAPLAQHVVSGTLIEPAPAVNAEPPAGPGTAAGQAATGEQEQAANPATSSTTTPASTHAGEPGRGPRHHQQEHAVAADPAGPGATQPSNPPSTPSAPTPSTDPAEPSYPTPHGHGPRGHGILEALGHLLDHHGDDAADQAIDQAIDQAEDQAGDQGAVRGDGAADQAIDQAEDQAGDQGAVRGDGAAEHDEHPWFGDGWGGHGHGDSHGQAYGHGYGHSSGHGYGHADSHGYGHGHRGHRHH